VVYLVIVWVSAHSSLNNMVLIWYMKLSKPTIQNRDKDHIVDAVLYSTLFYLLSHPSTYTATQSILKNWITDRTILHSIVFGVIYIMIQILTKRM